MSSLSIMLLVIIDDNKQSNISRRIFLLNQKWIYGDNSYRIIWNFDSWLTMWKLQVHVYINSTPFC